MANSTKIFELLNGSVENILGELIDYLDGVPSKNFCPNGRTITRAYAITLRGNIKEITRDVY